MANPESKKLQVDVVARITSLEKAMAKAARTTDQSMGQIEGRAKTMVLRLDNQFASLASTFGKGLLGGVAAGGLAGLNKVVQDVARGVADIGNQARRAGLSTKAFQELGYVARQNRIDVDALTDGMKELSLRADEFIVTGSGSGADAFRRLGYSAEELREKLKDPSALFTEIIGKLGKLDKAAQIRIADEIFGGSGGERFVELIAQGEAGIRETIKAANDLGIVIDDRLIKSADELDRKFQAVQETVGAYLKTAIVEAADSLERFVDLWRELGAQRDDSLATQLRELGAQRLEIERQLIEQRERLRKGEGAGDGIFGTGFGESDPREIIRDLEDQNQSLKNQEEQILKVIRARQQLSATPISAGPVIVEDRASRFRAEDAFSLPDSAPTPDRRVDPYFDDAAAAGQAAGDAMAAAFIKQFEGYRDKAYWDTNAWRTGYGSDTTTDPNGNVAKVLQTTVTDMAAANRDLARRIDEFQLSIVNAIGADTWRSFTDEQKAALTSISYNYGSLPDRIVEAILKGGNVGAAIRGLGEDNGGINRKRRNAEADLYEGVNGAADAWAGLRDVTAETSNVTAQLQGQYDALGQIGVTAIQGLANALSDGKLEAGELLQILGQIVQQLLSMPNLGGLLGGLFGGGGGGLAGGVTAGGIGLWADGGYTGRGGKNTPAGIVHRGEYVFSKAAVRAAGGPAALEAMHRALKGYAAGGYVGRKEGFNLPLAAGPLVAPSLERVRRGKEGGMVSVHYNPVIDARGAEPTVLAKIERELQRDRASFQARVVLAVREANSNLVKMR